MKRINALLTTLTIAPTLLGAGTTLVGAEETSQPTIEQKESNQIAEKVLYNGKEVSMKKETKAVRDAKPVEKGNHKMGDTVPKPRAGCDVFTVGDKSRPRQDFIDVSSYQSGMTQKDFNTLKSRGVKGVVVKLTEGTYYTNPYAKQEIQYAKNAGMKVSVYHFSHFQNKAQAEAEADFFAKTAKSLGLSSDTLLVNDIEASDTNNGYTTQNSVYFALRLINTHKFGAVLHYGYQNWFDSGVLNKNVLGSDSIWEASYPYSPSANNLWFKGNAEAWQFTSTMKMPSGSNYTGYLDGNIDYTGRFTQESKPKAVETNQYFSMNEKSHNMFDNTSLTEVKQSTSNVYGQTLKAKRYYNINGVKYYSLYNKDDKWQGYVSEKDMASAKNEGGIHWDIKDKYVNATKEWTRWKDLSFNNKKGTTSINKKYKVKGEYHHFNGDTYYSLYDANDNWVGYTNKGAFEDSTNFGDYHSDKKYYSIVKTGYNIFKDKNLDKSVGHTQPDLGDKTEPIMKDDVSINKTVLSKGYYKTFDGKKYLSIYEEDKNDKEDGLKWLGYINANATEIGRDKGQSKAGSSFEQGKDIFVSTKGKNKLYNSLDSFAVKSETKEGEWFESQHYYCHFNNQRYLSLYRVDNDGKRTWAGYINAKDVNFENNNFGPYHSFGKQVKIKKSTNEYGLYKDKNFKNKVNISIKLTGKTFTAKGYYDRLKSEDGSHGGRYYSFYDSKGNWQGYMKSTAFEILK